MNSPMKINDKLFSEGKIICIKCKKIKNISNFWKDRTRRHGYDKACKECTKKRQRNEWRRFGSQPIRMYQRLQQNTLGRAKKGFDKHKLNISKEDFITWYNNQEKKCDYCKLSLDEFLRVRKYFGKQTQKTSRFGIDRKDNNSSYSTKNIVLSCVICNGLKGYFHDYETFKEIAKNFVRPKLIEILKNDKN